LGYISSNIGGDASESDGIGFWHTTGTGNNKVTTTVKANGSTVGFSYNTTRSVYCTADTISMTDGTRSFAIHKDNGNKYLISMSGSTTTGINIYSDSI
jgi:hypothetical protein